MITHRSSPPIAGVERRHVQQIVIPIADASQVSQARRFVAERTEALHFSDVRAGEAAIVATELSGNLVKHGGGGDLLLRTIGDAAHPGIELLALDRGRGMDVDRCLVDGYSTAGSPGTGLGAVRRLSTESDFFSVSGGGTAVLAVLWAGAAPAAARTRWAVGGIHIALPGQEICGDAWAARCDDHCAEAVMADGLGHGPEAAKAADAAVDAFLARKHRSPAEILDQADRALQSTRGAAVGATIIDRRHGNVTFAGIGNTVAVVANAGRPLQHLVSFGGIVGQRNIHLREFNATWSPESIFIAHSDGIATRWNIDTYPGLTTRHPSLIAGVVFRDFLRGRDDASIVVIKQNVIKQNP